MSSQQLGTTKLGRQRLQKKANSFADMVHLVAVADVEHADKPKVSAAPAFHNCVLKVAWLYHGASKLDWTGLIILQDPPSARQLDWTGSIFLQVSSIGATGLGTTMDADEANRGMAVSRSYHTEIIARTGQHAADRDLGQSLTSADSQHTHGSQNTISAPIGPRDHQTHLQQGHNTSTASLRSTFDHKLAVALTPEGRADDTSAAMPHCDAAHPQSFLHQEPSQQYQHGKVDWLSSTAAEDAQTQERLRRRRHLHCLEAAAANWRQRCGSSSWTSADQSLVQDSSRIGLNEDVVNGRPPASQSCQPQHAMNNLEARPSMTQSVEEGAVFLRDVALASAEADYDGRHFASAQTAGIPPPPLRPSGRPQARTKASWLAALRGDAPPWLL